MKDIFTFEIKEGLPAYRQITDMLRERIKSGQIPVGTRVPPIGSLAKRWKTNYFTLQNALLPLANEGLLESTPRKGTFVRSTTITCSSIGLYFGTQFWRSFSDGFYSILFGILSEQMKEMNIEPKLWIDHRPSEEQSTPWAPLMKAVDRREIQGVIATMVTRDDVKWLEELNVPLALAWGWGEGHPATVTHNMDQLMEISLQRLRERGCKTVGMIANRRAFLEIYGKTVRELGLETREEWTITSPGGASSEIGGFDAFNTLWSQAERPEGLLVFPDILARGVMLAMLEKQVRVPEDLHVVLHSNAEMAFYSPLPVDWVVTYAARFAEALIESIKNQVAGIPPRQVLLPLELLSHAEHLPLVRRGQ